MGPPSAFIRALSLFGMLAIVRLIPPSSSHFRTTSLRRFLVSSGDLLGFSICILSTSRHHNGLLRARQKLPHRLRKLHHRTRPTGPPRRLALLLPPRRLFPTGVDIREHPILGRAFSVGRAREAATLSPQAQGRSAPVFLEAPTRPPHLRGTASKNVGFSCS